MGCAHSEGGKLEKELADLHYFPEMTDKKSQELELQVA